MVSQHRKSCSLYYNPYHKARWSYKVALKIKSILLACIVCYTSSVMAFALVCDLCRFVLCCDTRRDVFRCCAHLSFPPARLAGWVARVLGGYYCRSPRRLRYELCSLVQESKCGNYTCCVKMFCRAVLAVFICCAVVCNWSSLYHESSILVVIGCM
jgi:hypothetical protein